MMASNQHIRGMGAISAPCRPRFLRPVSVYSRAPYLTHLVNANYAPCRLFLRFLVSKGVRLFGSYRRNEERNEQAHPPLGNTGGKELTPPILKSGER